MEEFNLDRLVSIRESSQHSLDRMMQDHKVKVAEYRGRIKLLDDMIATLQTKTTLDSASPSDLELPDNNSDTFKE